MQTYSLKSAIETAIEAEELGMQFYSESARKFADKSELKELFELLAKDEAIHKTQFQALLKEVPDAIPTQFETEINYLKAIDVRGYFDELSNTEIANDSLVVLKRAIEFEKALVLYYTSLNELFSNSKEIEAILSFEKQHVTKIMEYIISERKFRGIEDKW